MKEKVCLIIPPSVFLLDERVFPSLGILKVASALESNGHDVDVLDLSGIVNYEEVVRLHSSNTSTVIFGITVTTPQMPATSKIIKVIRDTRNDAKIIVGGPHPTLIAAAKKREDKLNNNSGRANKAFGQLQLLCDVIVAGDGEDAIFQAISAINNHKKFIDADDPKSSLFLTNQRLNETEYPARHLIDLATYKYSIDGKKATSLLGQLGCLAKGTKILLSSGESKEIEKIQKDDLIVCFDDKENKLVTAPVVKTWERDADDMFEITLDDGTVLNITGEHPIWTKDGWKETKTCEVGTLCGGMHRMQRGVQHYLDECKILQKGLFYSDDPLLNLPKENKEKSITKSEKQCFLQQAMSNNAYEIAWYEWRPSDERKVEDFFKRRAYSDARKKRSFGKISKSNTRISEKTQRKNDRRKKSYEESTNMRKGFGNDERKIPFSVIGEYERKVERWKNEPLSQKTICSSEQSRNVADGSSIDISSRIQIRRRWRILDRPLSFWKMSKSRFSLEEEKSSYTNEWRVLASRRNGKRRDSRLQEQELRNSCNLAEGASNEKSLFSLRKDTIIWSKITRKRFIGKSRVYNITVCPGHSYFVVGLNQLILLHNCPFSCGFCGGRMSPMLRRIRMRSTQNIVDEIEFIYKTYGHTGFMFYDDELNVNKNMVELMNAISDLQSKLGVDFRLRGFVKAELFNDEQAKVMYKAGFRQLLTGFESGSERILENINKKATREDNTRAVEYAKSNGLKVKALMSIGHPGESLETIDETKKWLIEVKPEDFDCTIITTYPGSPYYDEAVQTEQNIWTYTYKKNGDRLYAVELDYNETADYYKGDPDLEGGYQSYVFTDYIKRDELVKARDELEREVRLKLKIPFNSSAASINYEHSMGQGPLPQNILRFAEGKEVKKKLGLKVIK